MSIELRIVEDWRQELEQIPHGIVRGILFSGDRFSCCDEAVVAYQGNVFVGLATIAPDGDDGFADIVGLYVAPKFRRQGYD